MGGSSSSNKAIKEINMIRKIIISGAAVLTLAAMPALAQNVPAPGELAPMAGEPPPGPVPYLGPNVGMAPIYGGEAFAAVPGGPVGPIMQPGLYDCGRYLGWDPDPNIRLQLLRDACSPNAGGD